MKKTLLIVVLVAVAVAANAQLDNLMGRVRRSVEKKVEQKIEQKVEQKTDEVLDNALGLKRKPSQQSQTTEPRAAKGEAGSQVETDENHAPTPEEVMEMVPALPTYQKLAEYACEQNKANPNTFKLLSNPTTAFMTQMAVAAASGYVVMMGAGQPGSIYAFDEQLLAEVGITEEQYEAMSEEEQQQLAKKYALELQDRYIRTAEKLASDAGYTKLLDRYNEIESEISALYEKAESDCAALWEQRYGNKEKPSESDMCNYFKEAVPIQYKAVNEAMKIRKSRQLAVAKEIDEYVQAMAKRHPKDIFSGFYNQGGVCATAYVGDAARLMSVSDPR